ncbi:hypothetical protein DYL59_26805 [Pseudomonas kairouanensis]|uniref:Uncharacterized protein n=1 Tax=Pseudomonas kairouanensis TaxID=2293832 RepID=A0A4Z0AGJ0_9PSED|nr:hypothetical protein [Pseudomonas kairouanensis]TFY85118.1 hypothetical protein DYL59_26805 [Pseudomonas kairouanensis]
MKREQFLAQPEVEAFVAWLHVRLPSLTFNLRFKPSNAVPGGVSEDVQGFEHVIQHYRWKASWRDTHQNPVDAQTWAQTQRSLGQLREWLASSVHAGDEKQALQACLQVLRWGGVSGAVLFLKRLAAKGELTAYLRQMAGLMALDGDTDLENLNEHSVQRFDAGLTKIHALLDTSGSPIYDSRVGAAMGMLYSLFRQQWTGSRKPLLVFPSGRARGSQLRNPGDFVNGLAAPQFSSISYPAWARAQVRLGWIIRALLERTDWFAEHGTLPVRCHAFEASLFILGYDLNCFGVAPKTLVDDEQGDAPGSTGWVPPGHTFNHTLNDYLEYRRQGGEPNEAPFIDWLSTHRPISRSTAKSYCFAFSMDEFALFDCTLQTLERIVAGGRDGLYAVRGSEVLEPFTLGDERHNVCLVDVLITGRAYQRETSLNARVESILNAGYAGTPGSAKTLMAVGRNVGKHFGLLDADHLPTPLFEEFFHDCNLDA